MEAPGVLFPEPIVLVFCYYFVLQDCDRETELSATSRKPPFFFNTSHNKGDEGGHANFYLVYYCENIECVIHES